jgi:3-oxoadipate enol-lactonase
VGYSMGGMVAQLVYRRHSSLLSGLVLCSTAGSVGWPTQELAAFAWPAAADLWYPVLRLVSAEGPHVASDRIARRRCPASGKDMTL